MPNTRRHLPSALLSVLTASAVVGCEQMGTGPPASIQDGLSVPVLANASMTGLPDIIVSTTSDLADFGGAQQVSDLPGPDGKTSLREAIIAANRTPGPQLVGFAIPTTDPNFDGAVFVIQPVNHLPNLSDDETTIDGTTQAALIGDTNPAGPEIFLEGSLQVDLSWEGLAVSSSRNRIKHLAIGGFPDKGLDLTGDQNAVEDCFIGLHPNGSDPHPNGSIGIRVDGTNHRIQGNLISGNQDIGLVLWDAQGCTVEGNKIGTDVTGKVARPNHYFGILVFGSNNIWINGNLISGNQDGGLVLGGARGCTVEGNKIGTDITGTTPVSNGSSGISVAENSTDNFLTRNLIAFNPGSGVSVSQASMDNEISENSIFDNGALGIDLTTSYQSDGVTPNDRGDVDTGPNGFMNFPVLNSAQAKRDRLVVKGLIDTADPRSVVVEFFANERCDPSSHGEGQIPLGTTRPNKRGMITATLPAVSAGFWITATGTDANGNTSEFSACRKAIPPGESG